MYQIDWASSKRWSLEKGRVSAGSSRLHTADISGVTLIQWQEHCVECAVPLCYETCYLYVARADNRCARFDYGIMRNRDVSGLERYGADIRFRRSGKLEAELTGRIVSPRVHTLLERIGMTERVRPGLRQAKALWNFALKQVLPNANHRWLNRLFYFPRTARRQGALGRNHGTYVPPRQRAL